VASTNRTGDFLKMSTTTTDNTRYNNAWEAHIKQIKSFALTLDNEETTQEVWETAERLLEVLETEMTVRVEKMSTFTQYSVTNPYTEKRYIVRSVKTAIEVCQEMFECSIEESKEDIERALGLGFTGYATSCLTGDTCYIKIA
jgi:hypothetical protein